MSVIVILLSEAAILKYEQPTLPKSQPNLTFSNSVNKLIAFGEEKSEYIDPISSRPTISSTTVNSTDAIPWIGSVLWISDVPLTLLNKLANLH